MAEVKQEFTTLEEVKEIEAKKAAGGYVGNDKYDIAEYSKAGVTWEHNIWSKDRYFVRGVQINQKMAETVTDKYFQLGRPLTDDELRILGVNI